MSSISGILRLGMNPRRGNSMGRHTYAVAVVTAMLALVLSAPLASADTAGIIAPSDPLNPTVDSCWQDTTSTVDTPTCSVATPGQFFETAAAHPPVGFSQCI